MRWVTLLVVASMACGEPPPKAPHVFVPLDEPHAAEIIARVFREGRLEPEAGKEVSVSGHRIKLEAAAAGKKIGVAYLSAAEAADLEGILPARPAGSNALVIVPASSAQGPVYVLALFARDYKEDDLEGEAHTQTSIAATRKLERDVRDFLRRAEMEGWK